MKKKVIKPALVALICAGGLAAGNVALQVKSQRQTIRQMKTQAETNARAESSPCLERDLARIIEETPETANAPSAYTPVMVRPECPQETVAQKRTTADVKEDQKNSRDHTLMQAAGEALRSFVDFQ